MKSLRVINGSKGARKDAKMKSKKVTGEQKVQIVAELDAGTPAKDLSRKHGLSQGTLYNWKKKLSGLTISDVRKMRALEEENRKLKRIVADLTLDNMALRDINSKKW